MTDDVVEPGGHPDRADVNGDGSHRQPIEANDASRTEPGSPRSRWHVNHRSVWIQKADRKGAVLPWECAFCGRLALSHEPVFDAKQPAGQTVQ